MYAFIRSFVRSFPPSSFSGFSSITMATSMSDDAVRQLRIKSGSLRRVFKEMVKEGAEESHRVGLFFLSLSLSLF